MPFRFVVAEEKLPARTLVDDPAYGACTDDHWLLATWMVSVLAWRAATITHYDRPEIRRHD